MRTLLAGGGLALALAGLSWAAAGEGSAAPLAARRLGTFMILGAAGLAPLLITPSHPRRVGREMLLHLCGLVLLLLLALGSGLERENAFLGAGLVSGAWLIFWSWTLPFRLGETSALGPLIFLGGLGVVMGSPYLVPVNTTVLPAWVVDWNPLLRLHWHLEGRDWLRSSLLYARSGGAYFVYPQGFSGVAGLVGSVPAALFLWLVLGYRRARRPSSSQG